MNIRQINPNTSDAMIDMMAQAARQVAGSGPQILAVRTDVVSAF